jgi:hypothetical protein
VRLALAAQGQVAVREQVASRAEAAEVATQPVVQLALAVVTVPAVATVPAAVVVAVPLRTALAIFMAMRALRVRPLTARFVASRAIIPGLFIRSASGAAGTTSAVSR